VAAGVTLAAPGGVDAAPQEVQGSSGRFSGVLIPPTKDLTLPWQWIALLTLQIAPHPPPSTHHHHPLAVLALYSSRRLFLHLELPATTQDSEVPTRMQGSEALTKMQDLEALSRVQDSEVVIKMQGSVNKQEQEQGS
jgi:hypothetical protein